MVKKGFAAVDKRFDGVDRRFDGIDDRLDRIEKLILADHKRRIERLEDQVKDLRDLLAVK
jgi:archaellum component FlaC